jgi:hypothetical protein
MTDEKRTVTELLCPINTIPRQAALKRSGRFQNVSLFMEVEQSTVIKLFVEDGMKGLELIESLHKHYGGDALQRTQIYHWIKEVKSRRKAFSNVPAPGRAPDEGLSDCIAMVLKEDLHLSTRKIANALTISSTTVRGHLTTSLGMRCYRLRWFPHSLTAAEKAKRAEMAGSRLQTLETHAASNFHFLWTGDESWAFYEHHHETMWAVSWEEGDELERPRHYHRRTMATAFVNGTGENFLNILPRSRSMDTKHFAEELVYGLEDVCYPKGRNRPKRQLLFILTMRPCTTQEPSGDN